MPVKCFLGRLELTFRSRYDERFERLKPGAGGIVKLLLAEHTMGFILDEWKRHLGIGEILGEFSSRLPKRRPQLRSGAWQHSCRK